MAISQTNAILQYLRDAIGQGEAEESDGELLNRFLKRREDGALAALVRRHAAMVWGVCRRLLRGHHDAEDAFQATFLVLVRKAAAIRDKELLANWLYGVAHQTAVRVRATAAQHGRRERQVIDMPEPVVAEARGDDLLPLLDEELSRLPEKFRALIVLCDLEAKTRKEVARQLGCPEGTIASRLARARALLAKRLARRGVVASGGMLAEVLANGAATASTPVAVVAATIEAATLVAAGQRVAVGLISAKVAALTEGVVKTMLLTKLKTATAVFFIGLVTVGIGLFSYTTLAKAQPEAQQRGADGDKPIPSKEAPPIKGPDRSKEMSDEKTAALETPKTYKGLSANIAIDKTDYKTDDAMKVTITITCQSEGYKLFNPAFNGLLQRPGRLIIRDKNGKVVNRLLDFKGGSRRTPNEADYVRVQNEGFFGSKITVYPTRGDSADLPVGDYTIQLVLHGLLLPMDGGDKTKEIATSNIVPFRIVGKADAIERKPVSNTIAWGKSVDGLQVGIAFRDGEPSSYHAGQSVNCLVYLRNTGDTEVTVSHIEPVFEEFLPVVVDAAGKSYKIVNGPMNLGLVSIVKRTLDKGQSIRLGTAWFVLAAPGIKGEAKAPTLVIPPGHYKVGFNGFPLRQPGKDADEWKWATGEIEFQVGDSVPTKDAKSARQGAYGENGLHNSGGPEGTPKRRNPRGIQSRKGRSRVVDSFSWSRQQYQGCRANDALSSGRQVVRDPGRRRKNSQRTWGWQGTRFDRQDCASPRHCRSDQSAHTPGHDRPDDGLGCGSG